MMLPESLHTAEQAREIDRQAIAAGTPGFELMRRAAQTSLNAILRRWPDVGRFFIFAGSGNNGGDGMLLAALAREQGYKAVVFQCGKLDASGKGKDREDADKACRLAQARGVNLQPFSLETAGSLLGEASVAGSVIVDALLGTGSKGEPRGNVLEAIQCINASGLPVAAIDLPSGLDADTGHADPDKAVHAALSITFIALKQGMLTGFGPTLCGEVVYHDLGVTDPGHDTGIRRVDMPLAGTLFRPRKRHAHKGDFGHVLVIGGDNGFGGAALMAAEAAVISGAGTVGLLTRQLNVQAMLCRRPEVMVTAVEAPWEDSPLIRQQLQRARVVVIGPGLGRSDWSRHLLQLALQFAGREKALVMDADALNLLAEQEGTTARENWILTPHPGEAARLLDTSIAEIQADRFAAVRRLQSEYGGCAVLKGAGTLIARQEAGRQYVDVCTEGNPGMATGGMGDVLSGIIGALLAQYLPQGISPGRVCSAAVCVHGESADLAAARYGEMGLMATDLLPHIREVINR